MHIDKRDPWGTVPLPSGSVTRYDFGRLILWAKTDAEDLWLAFKRYPSIEARDPSADEEPGDSSWTRWALDEEATTLVLSPTLPDRPVVAKPARTFKMAPQVATRVFVACPLWVRVDTRGEEDSLVEEIPTVLLSHTWFGNFMTGELCYYRSCDIRRTADVASLEPCMVFCPVRINNDSDEDLKVEKICLRVDGFTLYRCEDGVFWSDEMQVTYRGNASPSKIHMTATPPDEARQARPVSSPRNPNRGEFVAKTFRSLSGLPGLGFLSD